MVFGPYKRNNSNERNVHAEDCVPSKEKRTLLLPGPRHIATSSDPCTTALTEFRQGPDS